MTICAEGEAGAILRGAGWDEDCAIPARRLAEAILGPGCVQEARLAASDACLARVHEQWRIYLRPRLGKVTRRWLICHELAEWHLRRVGYAEPDVEAVANRIGAALVAPWHAYRSAFRRHGTNFPRLARAFSASPTCAALRMAEVVGTPVAVVAPRYERVHPGDAGWRWPRGRKLRRLRDVERHPLEGERHALTPRELCL